MVTTYDRIVKSDQALDRIGGEVVMQEASIDFATYPVASGDIIQLFNVSKGDVILGFFIEPTTAEGGAATIDAGITGVAASGLKNDADINATTRIGSVQGTDALLGYKLTQDDTIDILANQAIAAAKVKFRLITASENLNRSRDY